jgi:HK97 family phage major capsid protein
MPEKNLGPNDIMSLEGWTTGQKADLVRTSLVTDGGYMSQTEWERFVLEGFKHAELIKRAKQVKMVSREVQIPRIRFADGFTDFLLQPTYNRGGEALGIAERSKPDLAACNLAAREFTAQVNLDWSVLRDNVEKQQLLNTIRGMIDERVASDMEKIFIAGDTTSATLQLAVMDGLIALCTTNTVAAAGARLSTTLLDQAVDLFGEEYESPKVAFWTTRKSRKNWLAEIRTRATAAGDLALLTQGQALKHDDYDVNRISLWPGQMGGTANRTACVMADPDNMVLGLFDKIGLRMAEDLDTRSYKIVLEVAFAVEWLVEPASVSINDLLNT